MFLLYFALWVIFNGQITPEICIIGIMISAAIFWFTCRFADYSLHKERNIYRNTFRFIRYAFLLVFEIIKANLSVIHLIITQKEEVEPVLVKFQSGLKTPTGKAMLANAITLTPGTITVSLEENEYVVHCLDETFAEGLNSTEFEKRLKTMENELA